jgi:hypothetical protein
MPTRRLRLVAPLLGLLVALAGVVAAGRQLAAGADDRVPGQVEHASVPVADDAAAVLLRASADHLLSPANPAGPPQAWLAAAAASAAAALAVGAVAPNAVAVPSRTTAHVRRRGPPSPV